VSSTVPTVGAALEKLTATSSKVQAAKKKYLEQAREMEELVKVALTDREVILAQLAHFVLNDRQKLLVQALLASKDKPDLDIHQLLLSIPMSALEFINILRETRMAFSNFQTQEIIDRHRPKVVESAMKAAQSKKKQCGVCKGKGEVVVDAEQPPVQCQNCDGEGKITILPEHERAVTALEIAGVLKKGGGVAVVVNNSNNGGGWRSSPEFRQETDKIMYGEVPASVVDAEFVAEQVIKAAPVLTPVTESVAEKAEREAEEEEEKERERKVEKSGRGKEKARGVVLPRS